VCRLGCCRSEGPSGFGPVVWTWPVESGPGPGRVVRGRWGGRRVRRGRGVRGWGELLVAAGEGGPGAAAAADGVGPVVVEGLVPAAAVDEGVVPSAQQHEVGGGVVAAGGAGGDVVDVAPGGGGGAGGEPAALVAGDDGPSGRGGDLGGVALCGEQVGPVTEHHVEGGVAGEPVDRAAHDAWGPSADAGEDVAGGGVGDPVHVDDDREPHRRTPPPFRAAAGAAGAEEAEQRGGVLLAAGQGPAPPAGRVVAGAGQGGRGGRRLRSRRAVSSANVSGL
jgi:hypothetical protein